MKKHGISIRNIRWKLPWNRKAARQLEVLQKYASPWVKDYEIEDVNKQIDEVNRLTEATYIESRALSLLLQELTHKDLESVKPLFMDGLNNYIELLKEMEEILLYFGFEVEKKEETLEVVMRFKEPPTDDAPEIVLIGEDGRRIREKKKLNDMEFGMLAATIFWLGTYLIAIIFG